MLLGSRLRRLGLLALALSLSISLYGCMSRITKENAEKINIGMTDQEVSNLLGPASETAAVGIPDFSQMVGMPNVLPKEAKNATWRDGNKAITVTFIDGKVVAKASTGL